MNNILSAIKANLVYIILGVLALNILILDYATFFTGPKSIIQNINLSDRTVTQKSSNTESDTSTNTAQIAETSQTQTTAAAESCPNSCQTIIKNAIASITPITLPSASPQSSQSTSQSGGAQEFFVPFGAGSGASQGTYTTLGSVQSYVNMSQYTGVQTVTFEVSATIPNGNQTIYIQLYDATDGYPIPGSQVTMSGGTPQLLISPNLTLPAGNKLYQVQINTQLNSPITIDQARLHITTN